MCLAPCLLLAHVRPELGGHGLLGGLQFLQQGCRVAAQLLHVLYPPSDVLGSLCLAPCLLLVHVRPELGGHGLLAGLQFLQQGCRVAAQLLHVLYPPSGVLGSLCLTPCLLLVHVRPELGGHGLLVGMEFSQFLGSHSADSGHRRYPVIVSLQEVLGQPAHLIGLCHGITSSNTCCPPTAACGG